MGLFDFLGGKKDSGRDAGNGLMLTGEDGGLARGQLANLLNYKDDPNIVDPINGTKTATDQVQNNSILGQIFGKDGTMGRTANEEKDLASRGYQLQPQDHEAYGQASDNIARQFGTQENNLGQALAAHGLSNSGMAGQSFSGLQGNKMEQLGQMQRSIADDRMKNNMARLGQTRNFLSQMTQQAGHEIGAQNDRQMGAANTQFGRLQDKNAAAQSRLQAEQNQNNENLSQRQKTEQQQGWASALQGAGNYFERNFMTRPSIGPIGGAEGPGPGDTGISGGQPGMGNVQSDDGGAGLKQVQKAKGGALDPSSMASMIA